MQNTLRHLLATIAYRFQKSVDQSTPDFGNLDVGKGVRKPGEILHHMIQVLEYGKMILSKKQMEKQPPLPWQAAILKFHEQLEILDSQIQALEEEEDRYKRLIQGPLSDVLTHIGQIAMLRRLYNEPIKRENFSKADIESGRLGPEQKLIK